MHPLVVPPTSSELYMSPGTTLTKRWNVIGIALAIFCLLLQLHSSAQKPSLYFAMEPYAHIHITPSPISGNNFKNVYDGSITHPDSFDYRLNTMIAGIRLASIIRYDSSSSTKVIVYSDGKLDDFPGGYWIAISRDNGKIWRKYYTGLSENLPYYIKYRSYAPLLKSDSVVQLEIAELSVTQGELYNPKYALVHELVDGN